MKKTILKKIFAVSMAGIMSLSLMACGKKEEVDLLSKIKQEGKLTVAMGINYAPYEFFIMENGEKKMVGLDPMIVEELAKDLGVKYEIQEMEFNTIPEAVRNGKVDIGVSGLTPSDERKELVDFSNLYFKAGQGILINKKDGSTIKSIDDLKGKKIGAENGSTQATVAQGIENAKVTLISGFPTLVQDLMTGNLDAVITELPVADIQVAMYDNLIVAEEKIPDPLGVGCAIAVPKNQEALMQALNATIERLISQGKIDEFYKNAVQLSKMEAATP